MFENQARAIVAANKPTKPAKTDKKAELPQLQKENIPILYANHITSPFRFHFASSPHKKDSERIRVCLRRARAFTGGLQPESPGAAASAEQTTPSLRLDGEDFSNKSSLPSSGILLTQGIEEMMENLEEKRQQGAEDI